MGFGANPQGFFYTGIAMDGIININKPKGYTSHDVVNIVRRAVNSRRVGHGGTLDPNACGVLVVCVGRATKFAGLVQNGDKVYRAVLVLGMATDTQDITGTVIEERKVCVSSHEVTAAVMSFLGEGEQVPPMYSAIKVGGTALYKLARKNIQVERKPRPITIKAISVNRFITDTHIEIDVHCSSGTYIRTLCHDIGQKLGVPATMGDLVRLRSSCFCINNAHTIENIKNNFNPEYITPTEVILDSYKAVTLGSEHDKFLENGNKINIKELVATQNEIVKVYNNKQKFFGLYQFNENKFNKNTLKPIIYIGR